MRRTLWKDVRFRKNRKRVGNRICQPHSRVAGSWKRATFPGRGIAAYALCTPGEADPTTCPFNFAEIVLGFDMAAVAGIWYLISPVTARVLLEKASRGCGPDPNQG